MFEKVALLLRIVRTEILYRFRLGRLGRWCNLSIKRLVGGENIHIGNRVSIFWGARLEAVSKYADKFYSPGIKIEDYVIIGQNLHCTCTNSIVIGESTAITANVTITDTDHIYEDISQPIKDTNLQSMPVSIGPSCIILNGAVILPGTKLGCHCVVGANSVVKGEFDDYSVIVGIPGRVVRYYDKTKGVWVSVKQTG